MLLIITSGLVLIFTLLLYIGFSQKKKFNLNGRHIIISGGSKGIGREVALQCFQRGAKITILARDESVLKEAKDYICKQSKIKEREDDVIYFAVNVAGDGKTVKEIIAKAEAKHGHVYGLFNIVGRAVSKRFLETPLEDFESMMKVNYQSAVNCSRAVLESMIERKEGFIEFTSSMAGLFGIYGFTAYSASKFALLGLAQALSMEVKPYNISVTIAYPPDTDTPGFVLENQTKPIETKLICESGGLLPPSEVAKAIIRDTLEGKFGSTVTMEGFILRTLTAGLSPANNVITVIFEAFFMGPLRLVGILILTNFNKIVRDCANRRA